MENNLSIFFLQITDGFCSDCWHVFSYLILIFPFSFIAQWHYDKTWIYRDWFQVDIIGFTIKSLAFSIVSPVTNFDSFINVFSRNQNWLKCSIWPDYIDYISKFIFSLPVIDSSQPFSDTIFSFLVAIGIYINLHAFIWVFYVIIRASWGVGLPLFASSIFQLLSSANASIFYAIYAPLMLF